jgi:predicted transcriptional regulator of viral defense system
MKRIHAMKVLKNANRPFTRAEAISWGVNGRMLTVLVKEKMISKVAYGLYQVDDTLIDTEYVLQQTCKKCIFSHESALYHLGYSDRTPERLSITVPQHYGIQEIEKRNVIIRYVKPKCLELGILEHESNQGNPIKIYNLERTICDIIRHESTMDQEVVNKAIRKYMKEHPNKLPLLLSYAKKLESKDKIMKKLEVLL